MSANWSRDAIIVGGGTAGLSAALLLGRCLRDTLVIDAGRPRNEASPAMHAFLSRDGIAPSDFLRIGREQLELYPSVTFRHGKVATAAWENGEFRVTLECGDTYLAKSLLLATGLVDKLPEIEGFRNYYGTNVHHCPYCDAWECRNERIGVLGGDQAALDLADELRQWSRDIVLFPNGADLTGKTLPPAIKVRQGRVASLAGSGRILHGVRLGDGAQVTLDRLFFVPQQVQHCTLAAALGCDEACAGPWVKCKDDGSTRVPGVFVAGNAGNRVQMAMLAAAEGLRAAISLHEWLQETARAPAAAREPTTHPHEQRTRTLSQ